MNSLMGITVMDRINMILSDPERVPMSLAQIVSEEIREFRCSEQYRIILESERYYMNRSEVQKKTNSNPKRSNTKIEHPVLRRLIEQKTSFLLSKAWTVDTENEAYGRALNELFDACFRKKIKSMGKGAIKNGIAWLQPYFNDGKIAFMRLPTSEVVPIWHDSERTVLDAFIRVYEQIVYVGSRKTTVHHAELWWKGGVKYFICDNAGASLEFREDGETQPHFTVGDKAYNWNEVPIVWLKYNEEELPLYYFVKEIIDDINYQSSITSDVLRDVAKFVFILRNYGGADLAEFVRDLEENLAIKVDSDGGVDKLAPELNIDAVNSTLEMRKHDLYDYAMAVDTKDPNLGNASGASLNFRYADLISDCEALAAELREMFGRLKLFLDVYFQISGAGDFTGDEFDIVFNMDMPVNEADVITNIRNSAGIISKKTQLKNHPWVDSVEDELELINEEKQEAAREYGEGLFDDRLVTEEHEE